MSDLNERLDRLERTVRRQRIMSLVFGLLLVGWLALGASHGTAEAVGVDMVVAHKFVMLDANGVIAGLMNIGDDGQPYLELGRAQEGPQVWISIQNGTPYIAFKNAAHELIWTTP